MWRTIPIGLFLLVSLLLAGGVVLPTATLAFAPKAAAPIRITGKVTDEKGQGLPGANVSVKGTTRGVVTNGEGDYEIDVPDNTSTLVVSFIGYQSQEVSVGGRSTIAVSLVSTDNSLNEVVVVGYGTEKKSNLTGSVATITAKNIENRPVTNLSSSLAGLAPGVSVQQGSGKPGSDGASIRIRGTGTLNSSAPLIIVDGIISSIDAVNPNDVESVSILKDAASASIYGSLAANGVVLITTKKGTKNKITVSYTGLTSIAQPINLIKSVTDYSRHMNLINEGYRNLGQPELFSQATISAWQEAAKNPNGVNANGLPNYVAYPNTDWANAVFTNNIVQNHNLSVSGGSDKSTFLLSAGILNNPGTMDNTGTKRYQLRANLETRINKFITIGTQTYASYQNYGLANTDNAFNFLRQTTPGVYPYYEGKYGYPSAPEESATANNVRTYLYSTGGASSQSRFNTTVYATLNLLKGLTFESRFNYQIRQAEANSHTNPIDRWDLAANILKSAASTPDQLSTNYSINKDYATTTDFVLRYNTQIGKDHELGALVGFNQYYFNYYDFSASKRGLIDYNITTLGSATDMTGINGQEYDRGLQSYFGRVTYAYKSRYLFEGNVRYDGSSRFAPATRWGTFPSFSAGWRISEEPFMQGLTNKIQNLKLRASWGKLGNNASGDYDYQSLYSKVNYSFNGLPATGLWQGKIANRDLRWESTTVTDVGLEATVLKGALNVEVDWYNKLTDGILTVPPIQLVMGTAAAPTRNTAAVLNRGIEVSLGWRGKAGQFSYGLTGNFAYNYNQVTNYKGRLSEGYTTDASGNKVYNSNLGDVSNGGDNRILEGHSINEYYLQTLYQGNGSYKNSDGTVNVTGGPTDGMIRTPDDLAWLQSMIAAGYSFQPAGAVGKGKIYYGDFIYADNNGDGIYGGTYDRKFTGTNSSPKYVFGLQGNLSWRGFDLSMLWAGSTGFQYLWNVTGYNNSTVQNGWSIPLNIANDHYYYNDANPNDPANNVTGEYPRLKNTADAQNAGVSSTNWLFNAGYVKLKNLQIGYTLPQAIASKVALSRARLFVSGENLLMLTKYPGIDPEIGANVDYPTMRQYTLGLNLTF